MLESRPREKQTCAETCLRMSILSQDPGHIVLRDLFYEDYKNQVEVEAKYILFYLFEGEPRCDVSDF